MKCRQKWFRSCTVDLVDAYHSLFCLQWMQAMAFLKEDEHNLLVTKYKLWTVAHGVTYMLTPCCANMGSEASVVGSLHLYYPRTSACAIFRTLASHSSLDDRSKSQRFKPFVCHAEISYEIEWQKSYHNHGREWINRLRYRESNTSKSVILSFGVFNEPLSMVIRPWLRNVYTA